MQTLSSWCGTSPCVHSTRFQSPTCLNGIAKPSCPKQELTEADADKLAALLERRLGKPFEQIEPADMTDDVVQEVSGGYRICKLGVLRVASCSGGPALPLFDRTAEPFHCLICSQLLVASGMDKSALEDELAAKEEAILVEDFKRNLEFNLKKVGLALALLGSAWRVVLCLLGSTGVSSEQYVRSTAFECCRCLHASLPLRPTRLYAPAMANGHHPTPRQPEEHLLPQQCASANTPLLPLFCRRAPPCSAAAARSTPRRGPPAAGTCWSNRWARRQRRRRGSRTWRHQTVASG